MLLCLSSHSSHYFGLLHIRLCGCESPTLRKFPQSELQSRVSGVLRSIIFLNALQMHSFPLQLQISCSHWQNTHEIAILFTDVIPCPRLFHSSQLMTNCRNERSVLLHRLHPSFHWLLNQVCGSIWESLVQFLGLSRRASVIRVFLSPHYRWHHRSHLLVL